MQARTQRPVRKLDAFHEPQLSEHALLRVLGERLEAWLDALGRKGPVDADGSHGREVLRQLEAFRSQLLEHFGSEERKGIVPPSSAPRFKREAQRLQREHDELRARLDALIDGVMRENWLQLSAGFIVFRQALSQHEEAENDVVQRAALEDLGGSG